MYAAAPQLRQRAAPDEGDAALLRRFARDGDEASFAAVVRRHSGLVRGCAGRRVDDASLADDVAQAAFIVLARRPRQAARAAAACGTAGPWLLRAVSYAASNALKSRRRRDHHERRAGAMKDPIDAGGDPSHVLAWREIRPVIDDCLLRLSRQDRAAVSLRHLEGRGIAEVADVLSITPDAAKQRVSRATRRLRDLLERRGVTVPAATLAAVLAARAAVPAFKPDAAALLTATAGAGPHLIANGALTLMTLAKLKVAAGLCAGGLAVTAVVVAVAQPGGGGTTDNPGGFRVGPVPVTVAAQVESMPGPAAEEPPADAPSREALLFFWGKTVAAFYDANRRPPRSAEEARPYWDERASVAFAVPPGIEFPESIDRTWALNRPAETAAVFVPRDGGGGQWVGFLDGTAKLVVDEDRLRQLRNQTNPYAGRGGGFGGGGGGGGFGRSRPATRPAGEGDAADASNPAAPGVVRRPEDITDRRVRAAVLGEPIAAYVRANLRLPSEAADLAPYLQPHQEAVDARGFEFARNDTQVYPDSPTLDLAAAFEKVGDKSDGGFVIFPDGRVDYIVDDDRMRTLRIGAGLEQELAAIDDNIDEVSRLLRDIGRHESEGGGRRVSADEFDAFLNRRYSPPASARFKSTYDFRPPGVPLAEADPDTPVLFLRDRGDLEKLPVGYAGGEVEVLSRDEEAAERERAAEAVPAPATRPAADDAGAGEALPMTRDDRRQRAERTLAALADYFAANGLYPRDLADAAAYWDHREPFPADLLVYDPPDDVRRRIQPGDALRVTVSDRVAVAVDEPGTLVRIAEVYHVDTTGRADLPGVGGVRAAGMTADAVASIINGAMRRERVQRAEMGLARDAELDVNVSIVNDPPAGAEGSDLPDFSPPVILERRSAAGDDVGRFVGRLSGRVHYVVDPRTLAELDREMASPPSTRPAGE